MPFDDRSVSGRAIRERRSIVADEPRAEHEAKYPASVMHKIGFQAEVVVPLLHRDAAFRRAVADWQRCMSAAGHPAADPGELRARVQRRSRTLPDRRARRLEVAAAVAEARCVTTTDLAEVGRSAQQRARARVGRQYRRVVLRHRALQRDALRRVLAGRTDFTPIPTERNHE